MPDDAAQPNAFDWTSAGIGQRHVRHLHTLSELDFMQRYKAVGYDLMRLAPGHQVMDVGCGLGDDAAELAARVSPGGRAVGIDSGANMIEQATARHADKTLPLAFRLHDATALPYAAATFDAARTDRVLQHIPAADVALSEIVRVLKPGGRLVLHETDWGTLTLDVTDRALFRRIQGYLADTRIRNGWMGRSLYGRLVDLGLHDITLTGDTAFFTDYAFTQRWGVWHEAVAAAHADGVISAAEAEAHLVDVDARAAAGKHCLTVTIFSAAATKPPSDVENVRLTATQAH